MGRSIAATLAMSSLLTGIDSDSDGCISSCCGNSNVAILAGRFLLNNLLYAFWRWANSRLMRCFFAGGDGGFVEIDNSGGSLRFGGDGEGWSVMSMVRIELRPSCELGFGVGSWSIKPTYLHKVA